MILVEFRGYRTAARLGHVGKSEDITKPWHDSAIHGYIAALNDLRGFEFSPTLLVCFLMFVVFKEIFYGFRFVFIGVYREQSRRR